MSRSASLCHASRRILLAEQLGSSPRIVILRGGGLGDFLVTTPALHALRCALPGAHITLITNPAVASLARRYPEFDCIAISPPSDGLFTGDPNEAALARFFDSMRAERFDLALQWHGGGRYSNPFVNRLGAHITAGFRTSDSAPLDYWIPWDYRQHEVLRYLDLLRLLGIEGSGFHIHLPLLPPDEEELDMLMERLGLVDLRRGRYTGIHASAAAPNRRWAPDRFAWVADRLVDEYQFEYVLVTAGPGQESDSARVVESMRHRDKAVDLGGKTTLGALIALIRHVRFLLTNDSAPGHMAIAMGTPSVVVFGAANPVNWAPLERTWHRFVADWASPCRAKDNDGCPNTSEAQCLVAVQPGKVFAEAKLLLDQLARMDRSESTAGEAEARGESRASGFTLLPGR